VQQRTYFDFFPIAATLRLRLRLGVSASIASLPLHLILSLSLEDKYIADRSNNFKTNQMKFFNSFMVAVAVFGCCLLSCNAFSIGSNTAGQRRFGLSAVQSSRSRLNMMNDLGSGVEDSKVISFGNAPSIDRLGSLRRLAAVSIALSGCLLSFSTASIAADKGAGTITDKKYELCVSKCVFSETRPPPNGAENERILTTISRTDIIKDCRKSCAKTKEQLLLGKPKIKPAVAKET
jgi:hypothetical protein